MKKIVLIVLLFMAKLEAQDQDDQLDEEIDLLEPELDLNQTIQEDIEVEQ